MKLQLAKGVRDLPPNEKGLKNKIVDTLRSVFEVYGFLPLETPIIERYETLAAKGGVGEGTDVFNETFKLKDQGKRNLGLRFELTTSLARYVAMNSTLKMPFKRYEIGRVFRDGPIKLGRYREFWQCDVDIIGSKSMIAEAELLAVTNQFFAKTNLDIVIKINNRKILNGILNQAGIKEQKEALIAIDKLDKIGEEGVITELAKRGYKKSQITGIFELIKEGITLKELEKNITDEEGVEGISELKEVLEYCRAMNIKNIEFDVSLARGQAYYTGTIFEAYLKKGKITSSLAGGGRYDNMIGKFTGGSRDVRAVGLSFGIEPIMDTLRLEGGTDISCAAKILIIPINTTQQSLQVAQTFRDAGIATDFSLGKKGVSKNLQYANALGIRFVAIIGEDELTKNKILLRDMSSGEEQLVTIEKAIKRLQAQ